LTNGGPSQQSPAAITAPGETEHDHRLPPEGIGLVGVLKRDRTMRRGRMNGVMIRLRRALFLAAALLLAGCGEDPADVPSQPGTATPPILQQPQARPAERTPPRDERAAAPRDKGFDFYVLSLSWSPTWCAANDRAGRTAQCDPRRNTGFIVHGLWPQNEQGFPEFCRSKDSDRVPEALGRDLFDIMPSMGLIGHEWRKHGTCSGLGQRDYFALLRAARERVRIPAAIEKADAPQRMSPAEIETALANANPGLSPRAVAVTCDGGKLEDIRICMTRDLAFRPCAEVDRSGCRAGSITLPAR
jgi:ribonuclease T2